MQALAGFQLPSFDQFATFVASWLGPLSTTGLGFTKWEAQSRSAGAYLAILLVLALVVVRVLIGRRRQRAVFFFALGLMLVLLLVNVGFSAMYGDLTEQRQILFVRDRLWYWAYFLFCASIPCFVVASTYLVGLPGGSPPGPGSGGSSTTPT